VIEYKNRGPKMKTGIWLLFLIIILSGTASAGAVNFTPREIYSRDAPAVVFISAFDQGSRTGSAGTGSIITPEGIVLTNSHVITNAKTKNPYETIVVCLKPARLSGDANDDLKQCLSARVVSRDAELDLAVLRLENVQDVLPTIPVGDAGNVSIGDPVAAIGHPEGGGLWILTTGAISGVKKIGPQDVFQTEASINRGNSGGPLIDASGNMIGINTSMSRMSADNIPIVGVNFAVKSTQVKKWLDSQGINIAVRSAPVADTKENMALAPVQKEKAGMPEEPASPQIEEKKAMQAEELQPASEAEKQSSVTPEETKKKKPSYQKEPAAIDDKRMTGAEEELREFKGPGGEIMYGIPEGKFNLNDTTVMLYDRTKKKAQKAFEELDEAE
jgi:serine protease Do